ncbi:Uncharacterized protein BM_BM1284, partial [Brugia malayi]
DCYRFERAIAIRCGVRIIALIKRPLSRAQRKHFLKFLFDIDR